MAYQLGSQKSEQKQWAGSLDEGPAPGASNEDKSLTDDTDLQIDDCHLLLFDAANVPHPKLVLQQ